MEVVEVMTAFAASGHALVPGDRLLAARLAGRWRLCFNGAEIEVPEGVVGPVGSPEVVEAAAARSAREEEYQLAPPPSPPPSSSSSGTEGR